jgi:hypothetical protein
MPLVGTGSVGRRPRPRRSLLKALTDKTLSRRGPKNARLRDEP